jgi:hypothetical protein
MNEATAAATHQGDRPGRSPHRKETAMPLLIAQIIVSGQAGSGRRK